MNLPLPAPTPPTEFLVVGEHQDDPDQLLLLGADGRHDAYSLPDDVTTPVDPDAAWRMEDVATDDVVP